MKEKIKDTIIAIICFAILAFFIVWNYKGSKKMFGGWRQYDGTIKPLVIGHQQADRIY